MDYLPPFMRGLAGGHPAAGCARMGTLNGESIVNRSVCLPSLAALALAAGGCSGYTSTAGPEHCGTVESEVWGRDLNPHDITCDVTVAGDLVIGPGARIRFEPGFSLTVLGSLSIEGTAENPVRLESAEPDRAWGSLIIAEPEPGEDPLSDSTIVPERVPRGDVHIAHAILDNGGLAAGAALSIQRSNVTLDNVEINGSRQCGVELGAEGRLSVDTANVAIAGSNLAPLCVHPQAVATLPPDITFDEGAVIDVTGGQLTGKHTWADPGVAFRLTGDLEVFRAELQLDSGVEIHVTNRGLIHVGAEQVPPTFGELPVRSDGEPFRRAQASRLMVMGSSADPVVLRLSESGDPLASWGGLRFLGVSGQVEGVLQNLQIVGAGAGLTTEPASLAVFDGATVLVDQVEILDGFGAGVLLDGGRFAEGSQGLVVSGNAYPAVVRPDSLDSLPAAGSSYTDNTSKDAASAGARTTGDLIHLLPGAFTRSTVVQDLGVPYQTDATLRLASASAEPVDLAIAPGVQVRFPSNAAFEAGLAGAATLSIGEQASTDVRFVGLPDAQEPWGGVRLGAELDTTEIDGLLVDGAGAEGWAVRVDADQVTARGLTVQNHQGDGLYLTGTFTPDSRDLVVQNGQAALRADVGSVGSIPAQGISLSDNDEPRVLVDGRRLEVSGTWSDLGVPYRIDEQLFINGRIDEDDVITAARLTLEPGVELTFGQAGGIRTERFTNAGGERAHGTLFAEGSAADPIILRAFDPTDGFAGLVFRDEDLAYEEAGVPFPLEERSTLRHVIIDGGGALSALGAVLFDSSSIPLSDVTIRNSPNFGVALLGQSFSTPATPPERCETFDRSVFTFSGNAGNARYDGQLGPTDLDVLDFRAFIIDCD